MAENSSRYLNYAHTSQPMYLVHQECYPVFGVPSFSSSNQGLPFRMSPPMTLNQLCEDILQPSGLRSRISSAEESMLRIPQYTQEAKGPLVGNPQTQEKKCLQSQLQFETTATCQGTNFKNDAPIEPYYGGSQRVRKDSSHASNTCSTENSPSAGLKSESKKKMDTCKNRLCTCGLTKRQAHIVDKLLTSNNIEYLEQLRAYDYKIREKKLTSAGKSVFMYVCKFQGGCNKEFERSWNLLDHCRMHMGIKPYTCNQCGKSFTQKGNLNKHLITHN